MAKIFARIQRPSLRWGLILGIILGVIGIAYNVIAIFITDTNLQLMLNYLPALLFLVLGFYAGMRASQETGKWTSGLAAGLWVGVIGALIVSVVTILNTFINLQSIVASERLYIQAHPAAYPGLKASDYTSSDVMVTMIVGILLSIANSALFTTLGGTLGGFTGRRRALAASQSKAYEESPFEPPSAEKAEATEVKDEAAK